MAKTNRVNMKWLQDDLPTLLVMDAQVGIGDGIAIITFGVQHGIGNTPVMKPVARVGMTFEQLYRFGYAITQMALEEMEEDESDSTENG